MAISPEDLGPRAGVHLLNRCGFGPRPGDIRRVLDGGLERYILEQLQAPPDPDLETRLSRFATLNYPISQVLALYAADQRSIGPILDELYSAKLIRAVHSLNQLREVLVDFWFNHFNVYLFSGNFERLSMGAYEREAIRPHALGRFRDLLGATAQHPAMLSFLDNYLSSVSRVVNGRTVGGINENYGRELMELHTVGVSAGYTQTDVIEAARCFTGWTIDSVRSGGNFVYRASAHDPGAKQVFGLSVPAGGGREDGDKLLDYLAAHPATAHHVSFRLVQRFVADDPPATLVDRCAQTFLRSSGDIPEVMKTILGSAEFWAEAFGAGQAKTPLEFVAGAMRALDAQVTSARGAASYLAAMGMPLYACVPPTGYSNRGSDWTNPSSHLQRMNFALELAAGAIPGAAVDGRALARSLGASADDAASVVAALSSEVFGRALSAATVATASRAGAGGGVSVAAKAAGLCLASPEGQAR